MVLFMRPRLEDHPLGREAPGHYREGAACRKKFLRMWVLPDFGFRDQYRRAVVGNIGAEKPHGLYGIGGSWANLAAG